MSYKCDIKFMCVPGRIQNVVRQCSKLRLTFNDVAIDTAMAGLPLRTSQKAFSLTREEGLAHLLYCRIELTDGQERSILN